MPDYLGPGSMLRPEEENQPIVVPFAGSGMPNQFGAGMGAFGVPSNPDPTAAAAARARDLSHLAALGARPGAPLYAAPMPTPDATGGGAPPPGPGEAPAPGGAPPAAGGGLGGATTAQGDQMAGRIDQHAAAEGSAIGELGAAKAGEASATAAARGDLEEQQRQQADEYRTKAAEQQKHLDELDRIDRQNVERARTATIPDFWEGREGREVATTIAVALGGLGDALLGRSGNTAADLVQRKVDNYFRTRKEQIDGLYRAASAENNLNQQTRQRYAQQLVDLQHDYAMVNAAVATHIDRVADERKGRIDLAQAKVLQTQAEQNADKSLEQWRKTQSDMLHQRREESIGFMNAKSERIKAETTGARGAGKELDDLSKEVNATLGKDKEVGEVAKARRLLDEGLANVQPGANGVQVQGALDSYIKAAAGGRATQFQVENFKKRLGGLWETIEGNIQTGVNGNYSPAQIKTIRDALEASKRENDAAIGSIRERHAKGLAANPRTASHMDYVNARIDEALGPSQPAAAAAPAAQQYPVGTKAKTKDGRNVVMTAQGWQASP